MGAALTTPGRSSTARQPRSGKQDGEVYECRNQWWNPLKSVGPAVNLVDGRDGSATDLPTTGRDGLGTLVPGATVKACGVAVDRPAGEKLGTDPVNRSAVNVGTVLGSPPLRPARSEAARHVVCRWPEDGAEGP